MAGRRAGSKSKPELSERQRFWLRHIRSAEQRGEPLKHYADRLGLSEYSLYDAKRRLRALGAIAPAQAPRSSAQQFVRVAVAKRPDGAEARLRVRLASGAVLEWSEAPSGEALRELVGMLAG
jgi:hypothetical protein